MSTIKAINVAHPSSATTNLVNDSSGNVTAGANLTVTGTSTLTGATTVGGVAVVAAAPTATGNIPFSTNGTTWSSTAKIVSGTSVASTSGTSIDFTSIPSWVKRVTVMFNGVSTNGAGTSPFLLQIGSGSVVSTGYVSQSGLINNANQTSTGNSTAGFVITNTMGNSSIIYGHVILTNLSGTTWVSSHVFGGLDGSSNNICRHGGGVSPSLSGALDRVRITTVNGTDTFDAGSINILYE